jgi:hypothetical protein
MRLLHSVAFHTMSQNNQTIGERRVRTTFNPSDNSKVQNIKERAAEFINYIHENVDVPENTEESDVGEFIRLKSLALTAIEEAAMWGVKAVTF